jgi:hypothetical protein
MIDMDKEMDVDRKKVSGEPSTSQISVARVGRENLWDSLAPHETYEGRHRYDPGTTWTEQEERRVVWKTDLYLLSWICVMVRDLATRTRTRLIIRCSSLGSSWTEEISQML